MAETGEDCHFFMTTGCTKGEACGFRHSSAAKDNPAVCRNWTSGHCGRLGCTFRHPTVKAAPVPAAAGGVGVGGPGGPGLCMFFLKGNCTKGNNCNFLHSFVDPYQQLQQQFFQQQLLQQQLFAQQQLQQQQEQAPRGERRGKKQQQQQQGEREVTKGERKVKQRDKPARRERNEAGEDRSVKRALTDEERQALLNKPLAGGGGSKRFKEEKEPVKVVDVEKKKSGAGSIQVKSLAQIMAEKAKSAAHVAAVTGGSGAGAAAGGGGGKVAKPANDVDQELLAMGLDPKDLEGLGDADVDV